MLRVYVGNAVLTPVEQEEVISQSDPALKSIPNYTKEEFEEFDAVTLWAVRLLDGQRRRSLSFIESEPASSVWRR